MAEVTQSLDRATRSHLQAGVMVDRYCRAVMRLALTFLVLAGGMPVARAGADDCSNPSDQATMNVRADQAYKRSDAALNELYKQIMNRLKGDADTARLLVAAQRAWIAFRNAECTFATSEVRQGSVYPCLSRTIAMG